MRTYSLDNKVLYEFSDISYIWFKKSLVNFQYFRSWDRTVSCLLLSNWLGQIDDRVLPPPGYVKHCVLRHWVS